MSAAVLKLTGMMSGNLMGALAGLAFSLIYSAALFFFAFRHEPPQRRLLRYFSIGLSAVVMTALGWFWGGPYLFGEA